MILAGLDPMLKTAGRSKLAGGKWSKSNEIDEQELRNQIYGLFSESQYHISSHRKNVHALRALHLAYCEGGDAGKEELFFLIFLQCFNVILGVKKNEEVVTRMIRFVVGFVVLSAERGTCLHSLSQSCVNIFR